VINLNDNTVREGMTVTDWFKYVVDEVSSEKKFSNGIRDKGNSNKTFDDFCNHKIAKEFKLKPQHVCALRFYTTHAYFHINTPLRAGKKHPMPMMVKLLAEALMKLRRLAASNKKIEKSGTSLWRGFKNLKVKNAFIAHGGTELSVMSTSEDLTVAGDYSCNGQSGEKPLIMKLKIPKNGINQYGGELKWVSAFPKENEVCYPPLTFLRPTTKKEVFTLDNDVTFTVIEVEPTLGGF
jgi:hypothetical protein